MKKNIMYDFNIFHVIYKIILYSFYSFSDDLLGKKTFFKKKNNPWVGMFNRVSQNPCPFALSSDISLLSNHSAVL